MLLYTDGITEAEAADLSQYGEDRLLDFVSRTPVNLTSERFVQNILAEVKNFTGDNSQNDDITAMSIRI